MYTYIACAGIHYVIHNLRAKKHDDENRLLFLTYLIRTVNNIYTRVRARERRVQYARAFEK